MYPPRPSALLSKIEACGEHPTSPIPLIRFAAQALKGGGGRHGMISADSLSALLNFGWGGEGRGEQLSLFMLLLLAARVHCRGPWR